MAEELSTKTLKDKTDENETKKNEETESFVIKVGEKSVKVDKEKLIQASDYFKALFRGDFADSTKKEEDISHIVSSADVLKDVDAFVSRGDITLKSTNIEDVLKLSSYYQFRSLLEKCKTYLKDTLTVETCLSYYVLSKENNLVDTEIASSRLLKARFHDYVLFQESTHDLSPAILAHLCDEGFLRFCESFSLLEFISQWVCRGLSKDHITTGLKILRKIDGRIIQAPLLVSVQMQSVGKVLNDVKNALKSNKDISKLLTHLEITVNNIMSRAGEVNLEENETVLLTVSGRKSAPIKSCSASHIPWSIRSTPAYIESMTEKNDDLNTSNLNLDISDEDIDTSEVQELDVCVYESRGKIWYRLATLHREWIKTLPEDFCYELLKGTFTCDISYYENKIYLVADLIGILSFDLGTGFWSGLTSTSKSDFDCEMLQEKTLSENVFDSTLNVLNGDLYLLYEDNYQDLISIQMFNTETRQFENIRSIRTDIAYHETEEDESVRMENLCLLTLGELTRKSKRLMPLLLNKHDDLEMFFSSCVTDSQQPRVIIRDVFFSCDSEEYIMENMVHYEINDIGAIETEKNILFVVVEDNTAETNKADGYTSKEETDSTVGRTESENTVGYTKGTVGEIQSESTIEDIESEARKSESKRAVRATGCPIAAVKLDAETEKVHVIGEYDFETRKMKFRTGFPKEDISKICIHKKVEEKSKCNKKSRHETFGGENGFWRIKTASDGTSCCYNATTEEFKVTQHVPPPFSHIIAGCETELPRKLLATLKPINYMYEET